MSVYVYILGVSYNGSMSVYVYILGVSYNVSMSVYVYILGVHIMVLCPCMCIYSVYI